MIVVLGGGFGLYGHMAALLRGSRTVATLARYRPSVLARVELAPLAERITWIEDEAEALKRADTLVVARRPEDQQRAAARWQGERLVIEKPIAPTPDAADRLVRPGLSVPYLYLHCDWFVPLAERLGGVIDWRLAPSPRGAGWKRDDRSGGGALAFYFIHCCAVAEALFPDGDHDWQVSDARVMLSSGGGRLVQTLSIVADRSRFAVGDGRAEWFSGDSAFGTVPSAGAADPRIAPLTRFYEETVFGRRAQTAEFHCGVHRLWRRMAA